MPGCQVRSGFGGFDSLGGTRSSQHPPNSKLSIIVVDFLISKQKSDMWHKEKILELMTSVERHPAGNVSRFGLLFHTPDSKHEVEAKFPSSV